MSPFIKDASVQAVAQTANLADVVAQYTTLRKRGNTYVGLCPFHQEKTPSFSVSADKGLYYCFGCGEGGDIFNFLQKMENLSFSEAVETLAERFGIALEYDEGQRPDDAGRDRERRLLVLLEKAAGFYRRFLWESGEGRRAREYLERRGLSRAVCEEYHVGLSPSGWRGLSERARAQGFSQRELEAAGLAVAREGRTYDRFRGRVMFPLIDHRGRVVGFGGRSLGEDAPKYLNSSEGPVYQKGRLLYGLFQARKAIAEADEVLVVEGYTDVLGAAQAGVRNVVASMGTALTEQQLALMTRFSANVTFMFDADRAGSEAALRSGELARRQGLRPMVVTLPAETDPADVAIKGPPGSLQALVAGKTSLLRYEITRALDRPDIDTPEGRIAAFDVVRGILDGSASPKEREEEVQAIADRLRLTSENVALLLRGRAKTRTRALADPGGSTVLKAAVSDYRSRVTAPEYAVERRFLVGLVRFPEAVQELFPGLTEEHFSGPEHQELFRLLRTAWQAGLSVEEEAVRLAGTGGDMSRLCSGLLIEGEDGVYTRALLQHDYLRLQEQHVNRVIAGLRSQLLEGDVDEETERKLFRLELLHHEIRQMLADIEEE
ncbi:MAG: DNA primase [Actinobacteria bacterium ADurb.Bin444]|nr:MAG: DNA primase [Actinobacteria bacterium ADurb.Bin444]